MVIILLSISFNAIAVEEPQTDNTSIGSTSSDYQLNETANEEINIEEIKTEETNADTAKDTDVIDLASMVITWSGYALAAITIGVTILGFFGIREISDVHKSQKETQELKKQLEGSLQEINDIKTKTQDELKKLVEKFNNEAQIILQATYFYTMGANKYYAGNYASAIQLLKKSINYMSNNTDAICLLGRAYTFINEPNESLSCYKKAISIDPKCAAAYRGLAALNRLTNLEEAIKNIEIAVSYAPDDVEILDYQAQLLKESGDTEGAFKIYKKSNSIQQYPITDYNLGILYITQKDYDHARVCIKDALDGYNHADKYGGFKPVWKELAEWVLILIGNDNDKLQKAKEKLYDVEKAVDSDRTRNYVVRNINDVLKALELEQTYSHECNQILKKGVDK